MTETTEEPTTKAEDFLKEVEGDNEPSQKILVGPHPLGGIRFAVWDREQGTYVEQRIDVPEASMLSTHLNALLTMAFQTIYAQQAQLASQTSSGLYVPGQ